MVRWLNFVDIESSESGTWSDTHIHTILHTDTMSIELSHTHKSSRYFRLEKSTNNRTWNRNRRATTARRRQITVIKLYRLCAYNRLRLYYCRCCGPGPTKSRGETETEIVDQSIDWKHTQLAHLNISSLVVVSPQFPADWFSWWWLWRHTW